MKFYLDKVYGIKLSSATYANLSSNKITKILADGRHISPFQEALIDECFDNISYQHGNKSWDYTYDDGSTKPLEMRGFSPKAKSANLIPSNMIGARRVYNEAKYLAKIESISGYIVVVSLETYQNLLVFGIPATAIGTVNPITKIDRKYVEKFIRCPLKVAKLVIARQAQQDNVMYDCTQKMKFFNVFS